MAEFKRLEKEVFSVRLRKAREASGLTIQQAAQICSFPSSDWQAWESGVRQPNYCQGAVIATELNADLDWLCDDHYNEKLAAKAVA